MTFILRKENPVGYRKFYFPSGEMGIELTEEENGTLIEVYAELSDADSLVELALLSNALKHRYWDCDFVLIAPYIPFGRQDRHTTENAPFSLRVCAELLNHMQYDRIVTYDPHSLVTEALIPNLVIKNSFEQFKKAIEGIDNPLIIAPDAGAEKRALLFAKEIGADIEVCSKNRDAKTGNIIGYNVPAILGKRNIVVIDDICDGGATFIELAKNLPEYQSLSLLVTHGIFSKGWEPLKAAGYTIIYATFDFLEKK